MPRPAARRLGQVVQREKPSDRIDIPIVIVRESVCGYKERGGSRDRSEISAARVYDLNGDVVARGIENCFPDDHTRGRALVGNQAIRGGRGSEPRKET